MNPFVIAGPPEAGKTHLLTAIDVELRRHPDIAIRRTSGEELVDLVREKRGELARYDVLLIDDLRERSAFAYVLETLDVFARHGGRVVITTRSDADALDGMREWVTAFEWGYVADCGALEHDAAAEAEAARSRLGLDHDFLREIGLDRLDPGQADRVLDAAYQRLQHRVGARVVRTGLRRLERLGIVDEDGVAGGTDYDDLQAALPVLGLVVAEENVALRATLSDQAEAIALIESAESHLAESYAELMQGTAPFVTE